MENPPRQPPSAEVPRLRIASRVDKRTQEGTRYVALPRYGEFAWVRFAGGSWRGGGGARALGGWRGGFVGGYTVSAGGR